MVLTGAGISAESGLKTFRDADGLWEGHRISDVATPEAWRRNPQLVLDFYNERRRQLLKAQPNEAHRILAELESRFDVSIITQNVDDLHERAGSSKVLHLHGELFKVRSERYAELVYEWKGDLSMNDRCERGYALRPHIVWFGEDVPMMLPAMKIVEQADIFVIIGTSLQVYPAAGLVALAPQDIPIYYIDPKPGLTFDLRQVKALRCFPLKATDGCRKLAAELETLST